jgi:hypothetical protein
MRSSGTREEARGRRQIKQQPYDARTYIDDLTEVRQDAASPMPTNQHGADCVTLQTESSYISVKSGVRCMHRRPVSVCPTWQSSGGAWG